MTKTTEFTYEDKHRVSDPVGIEAFTVCCWCKKFKTCKDILKDKIINHSCEKYDDDIEKIMRYLKLCKLANNDIF